MSHWLRHDGADVLLALHVQPRAARDEIAGPHGDRLKVRITAPPVDGAANEHLRRYMARMFGVPAARVVLLQGAGGREKLLRIEGAGSLPEPIARFAGAMEPR